jgi:hypothetical protein
MIPDRGCRSEAQTTFDTCPNWSQYPSGYAQRQFAGYFIGDLYRVPIELEASANGCGFFRLFK